VPEASGIIVRDYTSPENPTAITPFEFLDGSRAKRKLFWTEVGFVEVKSLFTFYPREHRSPVRSYGL